MGSVLGPNAGMMAGAPAPLLLPPKNQALLAGPPPPQPGMAPLGMPGMHPHKPPPPLSPFAGLPSPMMGMPRPGMGLMPHPSAATPSGALHVDQVAAQLGIPLKRGREEGGAGAPGGGDRSGGAGGGSMLSTTTQVTVPQTLVPCLVGRGGCNVKRVKQLSGTQIVLREPEGASSTSRVFDVTGPLEATSIALRLFQALITLFTPPAGATHCRCGANHTVVSAATTALGAAHPAFKTKMCPKLGAKGGCPFGTRCYYAHSASELKTPLGGGGDVGDNSGEGGNTSGTPDGTE
eukprot:jgi/Mesvir1/2704/Mv05101-RA.1